MKLKISIIIVNYQTEEQLKKCLTSLPLLKSEHYVTVYVIDNASPSFNLVEFEGLFKSIKFISLDKNYGFAKACNIGISKQKSDLYLLLNPDTIIIENGFDDMVDFFMSSKIYGILGCKLINLDGTPQNSISYYPNIKSIYAKFSGINYLLHNIRKNKNIINNNNGKDGIKSVDSVWGAFFMIKQEVIDSIGLLDETFFLGLEENEFCFRAFDNGYSTCYFSKYQVKHEFNSSIKKNRVLSLNALINGLIYYLKKHFPQKEKSFLFHIKVAIFIREILLRLGLLNKYTQVKEELQNLSKIRKTR
jgi:hypothetical protein